MEDRALMRSRSWRWLQVRIAGLLSCESRLHRMLNPQQYETPTPRTPSRRRR